MRKHQIVATMVNNNNRRTTCSSDVVTLKHQQPVALAQINSDLFKKQKPIPPPKPPQNKMSVRTLCNTFNVLSTDGNDNTKEINRRRNYNSASVAATADATTPAATTTTPLDVVDMGYDTCGMYHLPPYRANNNISIRVDLTKAFAVLNNTKNDAAAVVVANTDTTDDAVADVGNNNIGVVKKTTKYRYFLETSVDFKKSFQFFTTDISDLWDVYIILCQHGYVCINNQPPKMISSCCRKTSNTDTEYTMKILENPFQMSITFGVCKPSNQENTNSCGAANIGTVDQSTLSNKLARLLRRQ